MFTGSNEGPGAEGCGRPVGDATLRGATGNCLRKWCDVFLEGTKSQGFVQLNCKPLGSKEYRPDQLG